VAASVAYPEITSQKAETAKSGNCLQPIKFSLQGILIPNRGPWTSSVERIESPLACGQAKMAA
jgi:hypothetical protein